MNYLCHLNALKMVTSEQLSAICVQCGMCCDGTLFDRAKIKDGVDEAVAKSLGLNAFLHKDGNPYFQLPCHHFKSCCTIYDQTRPSTCSGFFCKPLKKAQNGELSLEKAHHLILSALALKHTVLALAAKTDYFKAFNVTQLLQEIHPHPSENVKKHPLLLIKIIALKVALRQIKNEKH